MAYFEVFLAHLEAFPAYFEAFLDHPKAFWLILVQLKAFSAYFGVLLAHLEAFRAYFGAFSAYFDSSFSICRHLGHMLGPFEGIWAFFRCFGPSQGIFGSFGPFGDIFGLLGPYIDHKFGKYHSPHFYLIDLPPTMH